MEKVAADKKKAAEIEAAHEAKMKSAGSRKKQLGMAAVKEQEELKKENEEGKKKI